MCIGSRLCCGGRRDFLSQFGFFMVFISLFLLADRIWGFLMKFCVEGFIAPASTMLTFDFISAGFDYLVGIFCLELGSCSFILVVLFLLRCGLMGKVIRKRI